MNHVMSRKQFIAEADPMMRLVNDQFADIFGGDIVGKIQGATEDMRRDEDVRHLNDLYASDNFIQAATAAECLHIIKNLIERVSELTGDSLNLERAEINLKEFIDAEDMRIEPALCAACNGSGEGQYDGTTCWNCKGTGTEAAA